MMIVIAGGTYAVKHAGEGECRTPCGSWVRSREHNTSCNFRLRLVGELRAAGNVVSASAAAYKPL